ncbi:thiamine biosynthesis protein ThiS [Alkaliphilus metalliredigens QYMF]|uniref:Thiamine biosynthesis protein ThiS n=1 Tax=Alkaliphilus metalliredigens (strain QYMF) TaxID=293826 RepID=A6TVU9_ALKMQ|nr:sulfur carrier protein ThiS [Alkaliphilus metalliredigens]ABR50317.1 thiamine biosynthesis protein ThiS [Alkaliphilus metalliredigens QYMF]
MIVNGKKTSLPNGTTITKLLQELKLDSDHVVVEVNMNIIPKGQYEQLMLDERDQVEIVGFIGGG